MASQEMSRQFNEAPFLEARTKAGDAYGLITQIPQEIAEIAQTVLVSGEGCSLVTGKDENDRTTRCGEKPNQALFNTDKFFGENIYLACRDEHTDGIIEGVVKSQYDTGWDDYSQPPTFAIIKEKLVYEFSTKK